ncbi:MAG: response regulator transcription factor [Gammaproteobacteria bacterium]|nr:response regulator transcription factor [Gammaproteobacteria bacterium]MBU1601569.1 response regulator transcription factor [Gammaproteobacteria bacterium]MBU2434647.1 response regulator transcription factor [Gammaproteobacteria bacterium]MBU2447888.1 response regulator transcription factor [Gammaproteobacteria bacterium]
MKARVIIADDHQVVRQGVREILSRTPDLEVAGEAVDGAEADALARSGRADLLILDIALPIRRGIQVLESLRADGIKLPVLFFSMYSASQYVDYARHAGAQGFVGKDADEADLLRAIRRILTGGTCFPARHRVAPDAAAGDDPFKSLSRREFEVMQALAGGTSLQEIAARLGVSPQSVTTYRRRLLEKLEVRSNAELVALAIFHGQI